MPRDVTPDQFNSGLSPEDAASACGPAAAVAFARINGRYPTLGEAVQLARSVGWTSSAGMAGVQSQAALLEKMGIKADLDTSGSWQAIQRAIQTGHPTIVSNSLHYFTITGYDAKTKRYYVGASGRAYRGGGDWMTAEQMGARSPITGALMMRSTFQQASGGVLPPAARAPISKQAMTYRQLVQKYFPADQVDNAMRVMALESSGNAKAHNNKGEDSRGLFQINVGRGANTNLANLNLFNPEVNIREAAKMYLERGWQPWTAAQQLGIASQPVSRKAPGVTGGKMGAPILPDRTPGGGNQTITAEEAAQAKADAANKPARDRAAVRKTRAEADKAALEARLAKAQERYDNLSDVLLRDSGPAIQSEINDLTKQISAKQDAIDGYEDEITKTLTVPTSGAPDHVTIGGDLYSYENGAWVKSIEAPSKEEEAATAEPLTREIGGDLYQWNPSSREWDLAILANQTPPAPEEPLTREIGGSLYQWDPATNEWGVAIQAPEDSGQYVDPLDAEYKQLQIDEARQALIPEQQLMIQNAYDTVAQLQNLIDTNQMDPNEAHRLMQGVYDQMDSALRGTTPYQEEQARLNDQRERAQIGAGLISDRMNAGTQLAASLTSTAASMAANTMMPKGKTSMGYSPAALGVQIAERMGGGPEVAELAVSLLRALGGGGGGAAGNVSGYGGGQEAAASGDTGAVPWQAQAQTVPSIAELAVLGKQKVTEQSSSAKIVSPPLPMPGQPRIGSSPGQTAAVGRGR